MRMPHVILGLAISAGVSSGADKFVRPSYGAGSHTGNDWDNAYNDGSGITWTAGNTYRLAGGSYTSAVSVAASSVTVQRARTTNTVDSAATGWSAGFDSQPVLPGIDIASTTNVTINGIVPKIGILITNSTSATDSYAVNLGTSQTTNLTLINLLIVSAGLDDGAGELRCYNSSGSNRRLNTRIAYCTLSNAATILNTFNEEGMIVEHCDISDNLTADTELHHPNGWQSVGCTNVTVRYNRFRRIQAENIMLDFSSSGDAPNVNWYMYGNVVENFIVGSSRFIESQYRANGPVYLFNNTFVSLSNLCINTANGGTWHSDSAVTNNIFIFVSGNHTFGNGKANYNLSSGSEIGANSISSATSGIFTDYAGGDYTIVTNIGALYPRNKGLELESTYATDFAGNSRGDDGTWDIGAYEAEAGGQPVPSGPEELCCTK